VKADFAYDPATDVYRCPAGETLTYRYTTEENGLQLRRYWTDECRDCPIKSRCTTGKERRITRWVHEHLVEDIRDRISRVPFCWRSAAAPSSTHSARSRRGWARPTSRCGG
jgi:hypothetical protein